MRLWKRGGERSRGSVLPMEEDENDSDFAAQEPRKPPMRTPPRKKPRTTPSASTRSKLWLFLVANLVIITTFIFMSSRFFPALSRESVATDVLVQDGLLTPVNSELESHPSAPRTREERTQERQPVQGTLRPTAYTKLTNSIPLVESTAKTEVSETTIAAQEPAQDVAAFSDAPADLVHNNNGHGEADADDAPDHEPVEELSEPVTSVEEGSPQVTSKSEVKQPNAATKTPVSSPSSRAQHSPGSPEEIADLIAQMKGKRGSSPAASSTTPGLSEKAETTSTFPSMQPAETSAAAAQALPVVNAKTDLVIQEAEGEDFRENLVLWLKADEGVEVEDMASCISTQGANSNACRVQNWIGSVSASRTSTTAIPSSASFRPTSPLQRPVLIPASPDTYAQLPLLYFTCPMVSTTVTLHASMTLFFVVSPAQIESGDSYRGQKFFGNSPYGQFALHGGKPAFFANNGLEESGDVLSTGKLALIAYRLHPKTVGIKVNGQQWSREDRQQEVAEVGAEGRANIEELRISENAAVSLGNVKDACDTNAFQGRIAEVLVYDTLLTDTKVAEVERYLFGKWWGQEPLASPNAQAEPAGDTTHNTADEPEDTAGVKVGEKTQGDTEHDTEGEVADGTTDKLEDSPEGGAGVDNHEDLGHNADKDAAGDNDDTTAGETDDKVEHDADATGNDAADPADDLKAKAEDNAVDDFLNGTEQEEDTVAVKTRDQINPEKQPPGVDPAGNAADEPPPEAAPAPRFDPDINIFEWTPEKDAQASASPAQLEQWQKAVKERVAAIRNFELGGTVLRTFIRERKDELVTLRDELFARR